MATLVSFRHQQTGEIKTVKVGWSWTLFLFGTFFGIPFWMRKFYTYGALAIGWVLFSILISLIFQPAAVNAIVNGGTIGLSCVFGMIGNKETAKYYLKSGWDFTDPDSDEAIYAMGKWGI